ncbi:MAG: carboxymuconolactone decarboxylase family protein [Terriglobia bacterium]
MRSLQSFLCVVAIGIGLTAAYAQGNRSEQATSGAAGRALPKDVDPDSLNRLPRVNREDLDDRGKHLFDSSGMGPTAIRLYSPPLADYMSRAGEYLRNQSGLDRRLGQLAILVVAREMDNRYIWSSHEPGGLRDGLDQHTIDIVKYRKPVIGLGEREAAIIQLGREVLREHKVSSDTFDRAVKLFGKQGLVNLVSVMSEYAANCILLNTFDQQVPPERTALLPIP